MLWVDGVEHKKSMALLEQVEIIRTTPTQVDALMYEGEWLAAVEKISRALSWCNGELAEVGALHDLRAELKNKHQILYDKLINELQRLIYGQHSDDQSVNEENLAKMETLARALDLLGTRVRKHWFALFELTNHKTYASVTLQILICQIKV